MKPRQPKGKTIKVSDLVNWLPKQLEAWQALLERGFVLFGGSRGPGKSYWLRWSALLWLILLYSKYGLRGVRVGLFCETYPDLRDRQINKIKLEFPLWLGEVKETKEDGLCFFLREEYGGGVIALRNLDDPTKYQSAEFAGLFIDELTKISYDTFSILRGSKRWPGVPRTVFAAASNPGGVGHEWVKRVWIDRNLPDELRPLKDEFVFIRALPADNMHLSQEYWRELDTLPEPLRSAWRDGNWDVFAGMAFGGWNRAAHVVAPQEIPSYWVKWRAIDWGYSNPFCCLWFARDPDIGRVYVYREAYHTERTDRQQAQLIADMTPAGESISITYADPSMWASKNLGGMVSSTAQEYAAAGVILTKADNQRLSGKRKVDRLLGLLPDGAPGLVIFENCQNLIRTLPALPRDKAQVEDVDSSAEDHAYDALRYGLTNIKTETNLEQSRPRQRSPMAAIGVL
jgi:hypothetical protein